MQRRHFIWTLAGGGATSALLTAGVAEPRVTENSSVTWTVKGFTCITCAIGLETILQRQRGVTRVTAAYPSGRVEIGFDSGAITVTAIKDLIEGAGFEASAS